MPESPAPKSLALLLAALVGLAGLAGCGEVTPTASPVPRHVFLITVDTLRADHLGFHGYPRATSPALDALAAESVVFERAIAQWPKTGPSFASLFTGRYPHTTGLTHDAAQRIPDEYLTLPELFHEAGFRTLAVISNGVLAERLGWDRGFDRFLETWAAAEEQTEDPVQYRQWINARRVNELALPLLAEHRDEGRIFAWIHYSDPHAPYLLPDDVSNPFVGDRFFTDTSPVEHEKPRATRVGDADELREYVAAYDANVLFTDRHVGDLVERLRELDLLEGSLLVFTADHGESLGEHGYFFGHGRLPYNDGSHVPLFLHWPERFEAGRVSRPVELVDLYPTLADLLLPGAPLDGLEGESLVPLLTGDAPAAAGEVEASPALAFSSAGGGSPLTHFRSVQDETWKLVYHPERGGRQGALPPRFELYRLDVDPGETRDLSTAESRELRRLRRELLGWMDGREWIRPPETAVQAHEEETLKTLKALGYL